MDIPAKISDLMHERNVMPYFMSDEVDLSTPYTNPNILNDYLEAAELGKNHPGWRTRISKQSFAMMAFEGIYVIKNHAVVIDEPQMDVGYLDSADSVDGFRSVALLPPGSLIFCLASYGGGGVLRHLIKDALETAYGHVDFSQELDSNDFLANAKKWIGLSQNHVLGDHQQVVTLEVCYANIKKDEETFNRALPEQFRLSSNGNVEITGIMDEYPDFPLYRWMKWMYDNVRYYL